MLRSVEKKMPPNLELRAVVAKYSVPWLPTPIINKDWDAGVELAIVEEIRTHGAIATSTTEIWESECHNQKPSRKIKHLTSLRSAVWQPKRVISNSNAPTSKSVSPAPRRPTTQLSMT